MGNRRFYAAIGLLWAAMAGPVAQARELILLTGFEPFGGSARNLSWEIAEKLAADPTLVGQDLEIRVCKLPVIYDQAADVALRCLDELPHAPLFMVSLGEAECQIQLETAASNLDNHNMPDNAGEVRRAHRIIPNAEARIGFRFPVQAMFCKIPPATGHILGSISPGYYVCNNTAFHLAHRLRDRGLPFTFIHVPNSKCAPSASDLATNTSQLAQMLGAARDFVHTSVDAKYPFPHPANARRLPGTPRELKDLTAEAAPLGLPACHGRFLQRLDDLYRFDPPQTDL